MFRPLLFCDAVRQQTNALDTATPLRRCLPRSSHREVGIKPIERVVLQTCRRRKSLSGEFVAEVTYADVRWYAEPNCLPESLATPPLGAVYTVHE